MRNVSHHLKHKRIGESATDQGVFQKLYPDEWLHIITCGDCWEEYLKFKRVMDTLVEFGRQVRLSRNSAKN